MLVSVILESLRRKVAESREALARCAHQCWGDDPQPPVMARYRERVQDAVDNLRLAVSTQEILPFVYVRDACDFIAWYTESQALTSQDKGRLLWAKLIVQSIEVSS